MSLDTINGGSLVGLVHDVIEFRELQPKGEPDREQDPDGWTPDVGTNAVVVDIPQRELAGAADAKVAIFPSREDGIPFLEENNAWGFVRIGQNPEYAGLSIAGDGGVVMYVARTTAFVPASDATLSRPLESYIGDEFNAVQSEPETIEYVTEPSATEKTDWVL